MRIGRLGDPERDRCRSNTGTTQQAGARSGTSFPRREIAEATTPLRRCRRSKRFRRLGRRLPRRHRLPSLRTRRPCPSPRRGEPRSRRRHRRWMHRRQCRAARSHPHEGAHDGAPRVLGVVLLGSRARVVRRRRPWPCRIWSGAARPGCTRTRRNCRRHGKRRPQPAHPRKVVLDHLSLSNFGRRDARKTPACEPLSHPRFSPKAAHRFAPATRRSVASRRSSGARCR